MASISTRQTPPQPAETLAERFQRLAAVWRADTAYLSSSTRMAEHPAYQEIIQMGPAAVPLILAELARQPDHWFGALRAITALILSIQPTPAELRSRLGEGRSIRQRGWCATHATRQLANGRWTSKLGKREDIEHALRDLEGEMYGSVVLFLRRRQGGDES